MSSLLAIQTAIAARLTSDPALSGIPVIIDRQQDLPSQISAALGKMKLCIVLYAADASRESSRRAGDPHRVLAIAEVYGTPLLQPATGALAAVVPDVAEAIGARLDGWRPESDTTNFEEFSVTRLAMIPDAPGMLVWRVSIDCGALRLW